MQLFFNQQRQSQDNEDEKNEFVHFIAPPGFWVFLTFSVGYHANLFSVVLATTC